MRADAVEQEDEGGADHVDASAGCGRLGSSALTVRMPAVTIADRDGQQQRVADAAVLPGGAVNAERLVGEDVGEADQRPGPGQLRQDSAGTSPSNFSERASA